ncbi:hypothetical protein CDD83_9218 [Cordyceps sp. RAO-2017]|nr:hypothetical protein CDD83_9218 [Cordyceps sp. RAO-2017]
MAGWLAGRRASDALSVHSGTQPVVPPVPPHLAPRPAKDPSPASSRRLQHVSPRPPPAPRLTAPAALVFFIFYFLFFFLPPPAPPRTATLGTLLSASCCTSAQRLLASAAVLRRSSPALTLVLVPAAPRLHSTTAESYTSLVASRRLLLRPLPPPLARPSPLRLDSQTILLQTSDVVLSDLPLPRPSGVQVPALSLVRRLATPLDHSPPLASTALQTPPVARGHTQTGPRRYRRIHLVSGPPLSGSTSVSLAPRESSSAA